MGYTTEFAGEINVTPPLSAEECNFLNRFSASRRMNRKKGAYYANPGNDFGQDREGDIVDYNSPPAGQPGLWCNWIPSPDGTKIVWNGTEKFYESEDWMRYIIEHFIGASPAGRVDMPFLQGHICNGTIQAQGEDREDRWQLLVINNAVTVRREGDTDKPAIDTSYGETVAAIVASLYESGEYQHIYDTLNDKVGGFVGIWSICADAARIFHETALSTVPPGEDWSFWIDSVEGYALQIVAALSQGTQPTDAELHLWAAGNIEKNL